MQSIELSFESETSLSEGHDKAEEESRSSSPPLDGDSKNLAKKAKVECDIANECYNRGQEATTEEKRKNYFIKSVKYATMAAEKGLLEAMTLCAELYDFEEYGVKDEVAAQKWAMKAAEAGDAVCQYNMGMRFADGEGSLERDHSKAMEWWSRAASKGYVHAQIRLGVSYYVGKTPGKQVRCVRLCMHAYKESVHVQSRAGMEHKRPRPLHLS